MAGKIDFDLVTGGAGFIGSHLVDRLVAQGRRVRVLDSFVVGRRANLEQHKGNPKVEVVEADVEDAAAVDAACAGVARIFHLAARADIVPSIQEPKAYFRANVDGTFCRPGGGPPPRRQTAGLHGVLILLRDTVELSDP